VEKKLVYVLKRMASQLKDVTTQKVLALTITPESEIKTKQIFKLLIHPPCAVHFYCRPGRKDKWEKQLQGSFTKKQSLKIQSPAAS